jgi:pheromone shutdown protein TraB
MKKVRKVHKDFSDNEVDYVEAMRKKYPTMVRKLIDERNEYMAKQISECYQRFSNMVVVVGDAHVEGICALLEDRDIRKIRLNDLLDPERMNKVRDMVWKGDCEL